jgi:hypothetical protein
MDEVKTIQNKFVAIAAYARQAKDKQLVQVGDSANCARRTSGV